MSLLNSVWAFILALGILIVFHELGHFAVARWCGVKVLRFSVGFGPTLWARRYGPDRTEWVVAALPLGGYVKMLDEREGTVAPADAPRAFNRQSVWTRSAIVAAGPIANFLLAILVYWALNFAGVLEPRAILAEPDSGTPAAQAGVGRGDVVRSVNGANVKTWQQFRLRVLDALMGGASVRIEVEDRQGRVAERDLQFGAGGAGEIDGDAMNRLGLGLDHPDLPPVVGGVLAGSVAERAGLRTGDRILAVSGETIPTWARLVAIVRASPDKPLRFRIARDGEERELALVPEAAADAAGAGRIGASVYVDPASYADSMIEVRYGPVAALSEAVRQTVEMAALSLRMLGRMAIGEISWRNLSGPVTIADYAGQAAQHGLAPYLGFIAFISISLGVLNLLPIPVLDGGHLMYYSVEIVKGSPVSDRAVEFGQRIGIALLVAVMAFALYNDLHRLLAG